MDKPKPVARQDEALGSLLKAAIERQPVPPNLDSRIRAKIEESETPRRFFRVPWGRQLMAAAAIVAVCAGGWLALKRDRMPGLTDRPAQDAYIRELSAKLATVVGVGLRDHIHCSVFRQYPKNPPSLVEMETKLGPAYSGLLPVVQTSMPRGYRVIMAHRCGYAGRKFVHLTLTDGKDLLSLVIAQKQDGETLSTLRPAMLRAGLPVYKGEAEKYSVAAFEAGQQLAFVVSEKPPAINLAIAVALAPGVRKVLLEAKA